MGPGGGGTAAPTSNMLEQGSLTSVGLDRKTKKRRPLPMTQPEPMMDPQNPLAMMAAQRPMMGSDPTEVDPEMVTKRKIY